MKLILSIVMRSPSDLNTMLWPVPPYHVGNEASGASCLLGPGMLVPWLTNADGFISTFDLTLFLVLSERRREHASFNSQGNDDGSREDPISE